MSEKLILSATLGAESLKKRVSYMSLFNLFHLKKIFGNLFCPTVLEEEEKKSQLVRA